MPTPQKEARVAELRESVAGSTGMFLAEYEGLGVDTLTSLRRKVIDAGGRIEVVKNRLLALALEGTPGESLVKFLEGPTAVTFCGEDAFAPARAMKEFNKELTLDTQKWTIKAAFVDGRVFEGASAQALADLPPVDQIKSSVVGAIVGPPTALLNTANGLLSDVVYTLQAIVDKQQS